MKRHYYISEDLNALERVERELIDSGVTKPQIHVLSQNDAAVELHHLNQVEAVLKKDVVYSMEIGAIVGLLFSGLVLIGSYYGGLVDMVGFIPLVFLSIVVLGFCTWEGGLFGIQRTHRDFRRFEDELREGKHVFFVDVAPDQEAILERIIGIHPQLRIAGTGKAAPAWVVSGQNRWRSFLDTMP